MSKEKMRLWSRFELLESDSATGSVKGIAVNFNKPFPRSNEGEVVDKKFRNYLLVLKPGCFKRTLDHDPFRPLLAGPDHARAVVVGNATYLEKPDGLYFDGKFDMETDLGRHNFNRVVDKTFNGCSVETFRLQDSKKGNRVECLEAELDGVVLMPKRAAADCAAGVTEYFSTEDFSSPGHRDRTERIISDPDVVHSLAKQLKNAAEFFSRYGK